MLTSCCPILSSRCKTLEKDWTLSDNNRDLGEKIKGSWVVIDQVLSRHSVTLAMEAVYAFYTGQARVDDWFDDEYNGLFGCTWNNQFTRVMRWSPPVFDSRLHSSTIAYDLSADYSRKEIVMHLSSGSVGKFPTNQADFIDSRISIFGRHWALQPFCHTRHWDYSIISLCSRNWYLCIFSSHSIDASTGQRRVYDTWKTWFRYMSVTFPLLEGNKTKKPPFFNRWPNSLRSAWWRNDMWKSMANKWTSTATWRRLSNLLWKRWLAGKTLQVRWMIQFRWSWKRKLLWQWWWILPSTKFHTLQCTPNGGGFAICARFNIGYDGRCIWRLNCTISIIQILCTWLNVNNTITIMVTSFYHSNMWWPCTVVGVD